MLSRSHRDILTLTRKEYTMSPKTTSKRASQEQKAKIELINHLNQDLAGELSAIIQYITYAAKVTGANRRELAEFFLTEVPDEQRHAGFLANKVVALGGEPTTEPRPVTEAMTNQEMVEAVLAAEQRAVRDYTMRAEEADEYGDKGLSVELENILTDETKHAEETERILRDWVS